MSDNANGAPPLCVDAEASDSPSLKSFVPPSIRGRATLAKFFRALGDSSRLALLDFILNGERNVSQCVTQLGLAQSRVSSHLACLADCGYITAERRGRFTYYKVTDERVAQLIKLGLSLAEENASALADCTKIDAIMD